ncbi:hypothetical protein VaNZ11_006870 [Volvox africanus]|uniref:Uncharacterized protein n=1 Tax=Volvox africanus TaxID=51714 RepID=A0ABQ5S2S5_9CHLO|nr:hypothetical protein VaNZ11_006870 [Volvox africanus]
MADEDYSYDAGDVDDDFDQIEYRPPTVKAAAGESAPAGVKPYFSEKGAVGHKRAREDREEHHVDVNTPAAPRGRKARDLEQNNDQGGEQIGYYDAYQQPASKRATSATPGLPHAVSLPYNSTGNGAVTGGVDVNYSNPQTNLAPSCQCGQPCTRRVSNTGKNPGRAFFKCVKPQNEQCGYFKWEDELGSGGEGGATQTSRSGYGGGGTGAHNGGEGANGCGGGSAYSGAIGGGGHNPYVTNPYANSQVASSSGLPANQYIAQAAGGTAAYEGGAGAQNSTEKAGAEGDEFVKCMCGIDCPVKISNSANNPGRQFFACPKMRDDPTRCRFFQWADEIGASGGGSGGVGGSGAAAVGNCYVCNQPGHFASSCPQRQAGGGPGGNFGRGNSYSAGAGAGGGAPCYFCNQTGHWARDCPSKQGGGGYSGGGGYGGRGGSSSGPPQSFASRFGREGGVGGSYGGYGCGSGGGGYGGAGGGKGNCYKCGQPGHWASSCPNAK